MGKLNEITNTSRRVGALEKNEYENVSRMATHKLLHDKPR